MKKRNLLSLVTMGLSFGLLVSGCQKATGEEMSQDMKNFYEQLTPEAQKKFMELDQKHKEMAVKIIEEHCRTPNECKGHREQAVEEQYNNQMKERNRTSH